MRKGGDSRVVGAHRNKHARRREEWVTVRSVRVELRPWELPPWVITSDESAL